MIAQRAARQRVTIANGGTTSTSVNGRYYSYYGVQWPTMTGATCTFEVCDTEDGTYIGLVDSAGAAVSSPATDGKAMMLPVELAPWNFWRFVSAGAEGAERSLVVICKT